MSGKNYGYIYGSAAKRYPRYFRCLRELLMNGERKVSSAFLAERLGIAPSQVRSDLCAFAGAGQQGYGYNVKLLYTEISRELGAGDGMTAVILGGDPTTVAHLAERLEGRGLTVTAHVSSLPYDGVGIKRYPFEELDAALSEAPADVAVVMELPCDDLGDRLVRCGVRGVWNMTQRDLELAIPVLNLPLGDIVMSLMCDIRHKTGKEGES